MFTVFPNEKTLVGYNSQSKQLQIEDITLSQSAEKIESCSSNLYSILFNEELEVLLGGYESGEFIQYKKNDNEKWKCQINYGNIQIGYILSSDQVGCIVAVGGYKKNKKNLRFVNIKDQIILGPVIETAFVNVYSLCFGILSKSEVLLSVGGDQPDYLYGKTNIFNVTQILRNQNVRVNKMVDHSKSKVRSIEHYSNIIGAKAK